MAASYTPLSTTILPGAAGYSQAADVTLMAMSQSVGFATQNATSTQGGMQKITTTTTTTVLSLIAKA